MSFSNGRGIAVDAHVHFHGDRPVSTTLSAAESHFSSIDRSQNPALGFLLLVESGGEHKFDQLANSEREGRWQLTSLSGEPETIVAASGASRLVIVCGQQVRCLRGIEVLALGSRQRYAENQHPNDVVDQVLADGAIPVLPWGFGKWVGQAGRIVTELFDRRSPESLFAGDNGGRLAVLGMPASLRRLRRAGFRILPGSDPFPFGSDHRRVGSFGFLANVTIDTARPWSGLRHWLLNDLGDPIPYGRAVGPGRFFINQTGIQIRNRLIRATST